MKRLTLALLTAVIFLLAIGGTTAFSDGPGGQLRRGFLEEAEADSLFHYENGDQIKPKRGVYEGQTYDGKKVSFVVGAGSGGTFCNTGDDVRDFKLSGEVYSASETTSVCRKDAHVKGRRLLFFETYFSGCEIRGNLRWSYCIVGRWADDDVVFGYLPKSWTTADAGFMAQWVRPVG